MTRKAKKEGGGAEISYSKEQLVRAAAKMGLPGDALSALLSGGQEYTKAQARARALDFLQRKV